MFMHFILFITAILTVTGFFGQLGYWTDLTAHFRLQYAGLQLVCALFYLLAKKWIPLSIAILAALINLSLIVPLYIPFSKVKSADYKTVSIALINVNSSNTEYAKVVDYISRMKPDILALEEINEKWISALDTIFAAYPYKEFLSRKDNFGIGLYSGIPSDRMKIVYFGSAKVPSILAHYTFENKPVTLLFTHPVPPANLNYYRFRNEQLENIASQRAVFGENVILIGDLNTTAWSYHFNNFKNKMGLIDSRRGFGLQISWPAMLPVLGITIDHVLISKNIKVLTRITGPYIGSDHYPIYIKLGISGNQPIGHNN